MAPYALAYAPGIIQALVTLPPAAEKLGRQRMLELASGFQRGEARPAVEHVLREIFGWQFAFRVDHRHQRVTLEDVRWSASPVQPADAGVALLH